MVKEYGLKAGAHVVRIAAAKDFGLAPDGFKPTDVLEGFLSVIVFGSPFPKETLLGDSDSYIDVRTAMNENVLKCVRPEHLTIRPHSERKVVPKRLFKMVNKKWKNKVLFMPYCVPPSFW
ncbi:hypothetical protein [Methanolapillus ohkumae]